MPACERCATEAPDEATYCTSCGHRLPEVPAGAPPAPTYAGVLVPPDPGPRPSRWRTVVVVAVAAVLVAGAFLLGRAVGTDDEAAGGDPPTAPAEPTVTVVAGDEVAVEASDGVAVAELLVARTPGLVVTADDGQVSLERDGEAVVDDAGDRVLALDPGVYVVRVTGVAGGEVGLAVGEVQVVPFPADRVVAGDLTVAGPVVEVPMAPAANRAWELVDTSAGGVDAVVLDVTDVPEGAGLDDAPTACELGEAECRLEGGRRYALRVTATDLPAAYELAFVDVVDVAGDRAVLVDDEPPPVVAVAGPGATDAYELAVGHPGDVVVRVVPAEDLDVAVTVAGGEVEGEVDEGGPGEAEAVRLSAGEVAEAYGRFELEVTASGGGGTYVVTVTPR